MKLSVPCCHDTGDNAESSHGSNSSDRSGSVGGSASASVSVS